MLKRLLTAIGMVVALAGISPASAAEVAVVTTADLNLRAGPGTSYPSLGVIPHGSHLTVYGCAAGYAWCDVAWGPERGWVASAYLYAVHQGTKVVVNAVNAPRIGVTVVVFDHGYWARYYRGRPWYRRWSFYAVH